MDVQPTHSAKDIDNSSAGEKMDDGREPRDTPEKEEDVCALFATDMPRDVWANPSLAALAALIDEDQDAKQESTAADQGEKMDDQEDSSSDQTAPQPHEPNATPENGGTAQSLGAQSYEDAPNFASTSGSSSSSSAISGARFQRRGDVRRRRSDRRASPYATAAAAGGRRGGSSGRGGGEGRATQGRRTAPTPGETQVLMSLWGL